MSKMKEYAQEIYGDTIDFGYSMPIGYTESIRILSENRKLKSALENIIKECVPGVAGYYVIRQIAEEALNNEQR